MTNPSLVDNNPRVKDFKRKSKVLYRHIKSKINKDITLRACQDLVAQQYGYKHWHEFHTEVKRTYEVNAVEIKEYFFKSTPRDYINFGYNSDIGLDFCLDKQKLNNHVLITGEKRKKINLKLLEQSIINNDHVVYMESEGEETIINDIENFAILAKRKKDIRFLSFCDEDITKTQSLPKNLPFSSGDLVSFILSLMSESESESEYEDMWQGRAISLISAIMMALVFMRNNGEVVIDAETILEHLMFENIIKMSKRESLPSNIRISLRDYLVSLPEFQEGVLRQNDTVLEHHGYLQMQFTKNLLDVKYYYGSLFSANPSLDYSDLTGNNKKLIIIIKFPSFEKNNNHNSKLTKMMSQLIKLNLKFEDKPKNKMMWFINNCPVVNGFAVVPAQARYLNISLILSYLEKTVISSNKDEISSIEANCNIKGLMISDSEYSIFFKDKQYELII